ncbi:hypothetical protein U14_05187 [Candidatus Moduliflexus flocculans]|uniref:DUF4384 domain-containing protein n=1 Tax=Candidatus Moduliflexus flocculans TaxID=1499966 RepID=A0A081BR81_9BACT|nr:hypothetical protein U14_05187 [Candidatus Moduliflexus flocculans]
MRTIQLMSMMLVLAIGMSGIVLAEETQFSETYNTVMKTLEELKPSDTMKIVIGTQKKNYEIGESLEARFQADQPCHITLMDISTNGDISFLIPSQYFQHTGIEAQKTYSTDADLGLKIKVSMPKGTEALNIFCTREPFALFEADLKKEAVYTIPANDTARLEKLHSRLEELKGIEWAGSSVTFGIGMIPKGSITRGEFQKRGILKPIDATGSTGRMLWPVDATGSTGHTENNTPKSNE